MKRQLVYPSQQLNDSDILKMQKNSMIGLYKLAEALLGQSTGVVGLACTPTSPASMQVQVASGQIYAFDDIDASAYGVLGTDAHHALKQGLMMDAVNLSCPAPLTVGYSINYLIQAKYQDSDIDLTLLNFYNSANPSQPLQSSYPITRDGLCVVTAKAGIAATTGSQTTPTADTNNVGLYVVTVAYGQTSITATSIAKVNNAPFIVSNFGTLMPNRNYIVNGGFDIWERGTSQTSSGYGSDDRWINGHLGSTKVHSQQAFAVGQTDVPGNPAYFSRTVVTSVANAANYADKVQAVEDVRNFAGGTATLSFWAKADANKNIAVAFAQNFGTGGSPSAPVTGIGVTTLPLTTSWQYFTVSVNVPSISGKTFGTNNNHYFEVDFWFDAGSNHNARTNSLGQQSGTFDIAQVKLEEGSVATPFCRAGDGTAMEELIICQKYFEVVVGVADYTDTLNAAYIIRGYPFKVRKRTPTPAVTPVGSIVYYSGATPTNVASPTFTINSTSVQVSATGLTNARGFTTVVLNIDAEL